MFERLNEFFVGNLWGIVLIGIVSSLLASLLWKYATILRDRYYKRMEKRKLVQKAKRIAHSYSIGYTFGYAEGLNTYPQMILLSEFSSRMVLSVVWLFITVVVCATVTISLGLMFMPLTIACSSFVITIMYKRVKRSTLPFRFAYEKFFDEKFRKSMTEDMKDYIKKRVGEQSQQEEATPK